MMHSDTILSNLRNTIEVLPSTLINNGNRADGGDTEPRWNFNDPSFYVRDLRTEVNSQNNNIIAIISKLCVFCRHQGKLKEVQQEIRIF